MPRPRFGRRVLPVVLGTSLLVNASCGTLLHPERIGQPPGRIDPGIVALNGVGLLLFLIPGVIAFAIDFYTGAIYLPPQYALDGGAAGSSDEPLIAVQLDPATLTADRVQEVLSARTGRDIELYPGSYSVVRLESLEEFASARERLARHEQTPDANLVIFRCQSE